MLAEADLIALVRHADDDQADASSRVEQLVHQFQLRRLRLDEHGGERRAQAAATGVSSIGGGTVPPLPGAVSAVKSRWSSRAMDYSRHALNAHRPWSTPS
jgi:hypothetical protein